MKCTAVLHGSTSTTCPCHFNLLSWTSFAISPTFVVHHILSFLILSSFLTLNTHRRILISATSNLFHCAFFNTHVSAMHISAGLTTVVNTCPLVFTFISLSHNTPDTLFHSFHQHGTLWAPNASSLPSSTNVDCGDYTNIEQIQMLRDDKKPWTKWYKLLLPTTVLLIDYV